MVKFGLARKVTAVGLTSILDRGQFTYVPQEDSSTDLYPDSYVPNSNHSDHILTHSTDPYLSVLHAELDTRERAAPCPLQPKSIVAKVTVSDRVWL